MTETYKKHTHREHILELPDTYVGSCETTEEQRWVYDVEAGKMTWKTVAFNPGLYKIFDEILVNARDAFVRASTAPASAKRLPIKSIDIAVGPGVDAGEPVVVSVENDGDGIPIEEHPTEGCYIPEMIFGHLLTSSNYNKAEEKIVGGKNGYGSKCVRDDTPIPLWNGSTKLAKDILAGDQLIGDDGTVRTVQSVFHGTGQLYTVNQASAEPYTVNEEHTLTLMMPDHKVIFWNGSKNGWSMLWWDKENTSIRQTTVAINKPLTSTCEECGETLASNIQRHYSRKHPEKAVPSKPRKSPTKIPEMTAEVTAALEKLEEIAKTIDDANVFDMDIKDFMALNNTTKLRLSGVRGKCVDWESRPVSLDPYLLGLWLGDGYSTGYGFACNSQKDPEILTYFENWSKDHDTTITQAATYAFRFSSTNNYKKKGFAPLRKELAKYNLVDNKHIPTDYLVNDRATRLQVLAGLIDTDGHVSRDGSRVVISQGEVHATLAHQIQTLARSLGFCVNMTLRDVKYAYKGEKLMSRAFMINISGENLGDIPTRLPRKKCGSTVARKTSSSTGILTIQDAGIGNYVGIKIDGNERFLVNDYTVTHNCTNIFSSRFTLETQSPAHGKKYTQIWRNNMSVCEKPSIRKSTGTKGYVKVEFVPDASRFKGAFQSSDESKRAAGGAGAGAGAGVAATAMGSNGLTPDMYAIFHTRVIELAAMVGAGVKVTWNGTHVITNTFEKYMKLFLREGMAGITYEACGPRWEVGAVLAHHLYSDEEGLPEEKHISFVNGILTRKGGKHVDYVAKHVLGDFCELAKKKKVEIKPGQLKDHVVFFVNATIVNPAFESQTKECLTTPASKFGSTPTFTTKLPEGLFKLGLLEEAKAVLEARAARDAKKTDGKKRSTIRGLPKLEDALWAGTAKSGECTLILTEGDSAATSAISGLNVVGREKWGVFPLRGKLLNVKDITIQKFNANEELTAIKRILGLEHGKTYKSVGELRYGRVMIMADQDHDGSHIKGLVMNLFQTEWPSLLEAGFLCSLLTPLLKASRGATTIPFYSSQEYDAWKAAETAAGRNVASWHLKYYKGLGTSTPAEAREWFEKLEEIHYIKDPTTDEAISLAFDKKRADDRKEWLSHYDPAATLTLDGRKASYSSFIHKELVHFSNAANIRALPHLMDGLKPSQRKILYSCLKRNLRSEIKVAQLAGYVSEHSAYHHGEASLNETIVGMAQTFVGSNNINLLKPIGQFGSRLLGGKDSASPRYIHTHLEGIVDAIFRKEDAMLLKHVEDDGEFVEPEYYLPVVPLLAINGCEGIGTGYSTSVPPHNPEEIVKLLQCRLTGGLDTLAKRALDPWWFGFKGALTRKSENTWVTKGTYTCDESKHTITITELPVGMWTKKYKEILDEMLSGEGKDTHGLKNFDDLYNDLQVKFVLYFTEDGFDEAVRDKEAFEKNFKLTTSWTTSNMHCFNNEFDIKKFSCVGDILESFVETRLPAYEARRVAQLEKLLAEIRELEAKRAFLAAILDGSLTLMRKTDEEIVENLKKIGIPALSDPGKADSVDGYDFVLRMRIDRVKASAIADADEQVAAKKGEIASLESTTPAAMWLADLAAFEKAWTAYKTARLEELEGAAKATSSSKKTVVRRKKPVTPKAGRGAGTGAGAGAGAGATYDE